MFVGEPLGPVPRLCTGLLAWPLSPLEWESVAGAGAGEGSWEGVVPLGDFPLVAVVVAVPVAAVEVAAGVGVGVGGGSEASNSLSAATLQAYLATQTMASWWCRERAYDNA